MIGLINNKQTTSPRPQNWGACVNCKRGPKSTHKINRTKASKKYGLRSDSSYRFERGVDMEGVINAQARAACLIKELAGGDICKGRIDIYPKTRENIQLSLRVSRVPKQVRASLLRCVSGPISLPIAIIFEIIVL